MSDSGLVGITFYEKGAPIPDMAYDFINSSVLIRDFDQQSSGTAVEE